MKFIFEFFYSFGPNRTRKIKTEMILTAFNNIYYAGNANNVTFYVLYYSLCFLHYNYFHRTALTVCFKWRSKRYKVWSLKYHFELYNMQQHVKSAYTFTVFIVLWKNVPNSRCCNRESTTATKDSVSKSAVGRFVSHYCCMRWDDPYTSCVGVQAD